MGFQVGSEDLLNIAVTLKFQLYKHSDLLRGIITPSQKKAVAAFVQAPGDYFDAEPTFKQSYAPQSGEIFGILKQMKETFESNLSTSQKEELAAQAPRCIARSGKLYRARSRLYRGKILQENTRWKALDEKITFKKC